jgi:hypothetical protein
MDACHLAITNTAVIASNRKLFFRLSPRLFRLNDAIRNRASMHEVRAFARHDESGPGGDVALALQVGFQRQVDAEADNAQ